MMWEYSDSEYLKLFRKMTNWEWYTDVCTFKLFMHCLIRANWKSGSWHGQDYERGQFITSLSALSKETGLSVQEVRTALKHLKSTGELTSETTSRNQLITVVNFDKYQANQHAEQQSPNKVLTSDQQSPNNRYKNNKNNKNNKKENIKKKNRSSGESDFSEEGFVDAADYVCGKEGDD